MVKTPRTRHSKQNREPTTIDLEAEAVGHDHGGEDGTGEKAAEPQSVQPASEALAEAEAADAKSERSDTQGGSDPAVASDEREDDDRKEVEPAPEPVRAEARGGIGRALAAGVAGGVVALAIGGGLQWAELLPAPGGNGAEPAVEELRQELTARQAELERMLGAGGTDEAVEQALATPRRQISEIESQLGELRESVTALQTMPSSEGGEAVLQTLEQRLSELESRIASLAETQGAAGVSDELAGRLAALEDRMAQTSRAAGAAQDAAAANSGRLEEMTARLTQLEEQVESQDEGPRLALVVAASALRSAVERGEPFAGELETYTALADDPAAVEPLRQYAQAGIPTQAQLAAEAPEVASRIAASASDLPPDAGFFDRLMESARSAIKVRPVGEVEGDTPEAIAARMEAVIQRGDYDRALVEYDALPPAAKEAAGDFADKLRARRAADKVLEQALSNALKPA